MNHLLEVILCIVSSSAKFAMTFPLAVMQFQFNFLETLLWTNTGGLLGVYFFAFLSGKIMSWWKHTFRRIRLKTAKTKGRKRRFTKKNRRIVRIKQRYGLVGIAITSPVLLSIPLATFLVVRYYPGSKIKFYLLIASNLIWSLIYTAFYMLTFDLILQRG